MQVPLANRVGVDHLALSVPDVEELERIKLRLDAAGVKNNGVEVFK